MASSGDKLVKSSFSTDIFKSYSSGEMGNQTFYLYVSAPSFTITTKASPVFWNQHPYIWMYAYYYNWNSGTWINTGEHRNYSSYTSGNSYDVFRHNYPGTSNNPAGISDAPNYHLWRFKFSSTANGDAYCSVTGSAYSVGGMTDDVYNSVCKDKFIVSAGRLGENSFHAIGSQDDATALSYFNWASNTGTLITSDYVGKCIPKSWV